MLFFCFALFCFVFCLFVLLLVYCRLWKLDGVVPVERCRLVKFDHFYDIPEASFEGHDDVAVCKLISNSLAYCDLLLETRGEDEVFEVYRSTGNGCILKVSVVWRCC